MVIRNNQKAVQRFFSAPLLKNPFLCKSLIPPTVRQTDRLSDLPMRKKNGVKEVHLEFISGVDVEKESKKTEEQKGRKRGGGGGVGREKEIRMEKENEEEKKEERRK